MNNNFKMLSLEQAEEFVSNTPNCWWENYDIVMWNKNPSGFFKKNGKILNSQWGTVRRIVVNRDGLWKVPSNVRPTR